MAKNRKFKNVYQITVSGITTNGFVSELIHKFIKTFATSIGVGYQQVKVEFDVVETSGDYDAKKEINNAD